jgi:hypothetical protein
MWYDDFKNKNRFYWREEEISICLNVKCVIKFLIKIAVLAGV